jgi:protein-S-isoprenylcysteine O-methyltransferase Ste14
MTWLQRLIKKPGSVAILEISLAGAAFLMADPSLSSLWCGGFLVFAGLGLFTWTARYGWGFEGSGDICVGPARFLRYPILVARILVIFGLLIATRSPWVFVFAVISLAPFYRWLGQVVDKASNDELGPLAKEYKALVPSFVPLLAPVSGIHFRRQKRKQLSIGQLVWGEASQIGLLWLGVMVILGWQYVLIERYVSVDYWRAVAVALVLVMSVVIYRGSVGRNRRIVN